MEKFTQLDKNFTLPLAVPAVTNLTSELIQLKSKCICTVQ